MAQRPQRIFVPETCDSVDPVVADSIWTLEDCRRRTLEAIGGISQSVLDWRSDSSGNSIGALLYHIAAIEADYLFDDILELDSFPAEVTRLFPYNVREEDGRLTPLSGLTFGDYLEKLETVRHALIQEVTGLNSHDFVRVRSRPHADVTPQWVIHHLCQHEAEHRGQIMEIRTLAES